MKTTHPTDQTMDLLAPLWRRLAAMLYDTLLLIACYFVIGAIYVAIAHKLSALNYSTEGFANTANMLPPALLQITLFPLLLVFTFLFFAYFWHKQGCTLGMQTWKLKVKSELGNSAGAQHLSLKQCLIRFATAGLSIIVGGFGYWWMLWDPEKKTWQDHLSNSTVYLTMH